MARDRSLKKDLAEADQVYVGEFEAINGSGVTATAILTVDRGGPGSEDDLLTVRIKATGLDEGLHIQHMHGFETGQDAVTPNRRDDSDGDGFVELLEGLPDYGGILLNLDDEDGAFPFTMGKDGSFVFEQTYHLLGDDEPHGSHAGDSITTFRNLDLNHLVIHGMNVPGRAGEGTPGEVGDTEERGSLVFDPNRFKEVLPVAVAELEQMSGREARLFADANDFNF
ncbi:MAG TPA: hypothetical protein VHL98_17440 [Microvirga sp.]|jgi:hypothetical protein|nr:hypothetical protein [Microvirga sp.]